MNESKLKLFNIKIYSNKNFNEKIIFNLYNTTLLLV